MKKLLTILLTSPLALAACNAEVLPIEYQENKFDLTVVLGDTTHEFEVDVMYRLYTINHYFGTEQVDLELVMLGDFIVSIGGKTEEVPTNDDCGDGYTASAKWSYTNNGEPLSAPASLSYALVEAGDDFVIKSYYCSEEI